MTERHPTDEFREKAPLYALGVLDAEDRRSFERHMQAGCSTCQAELNGYERVVGWLGFSAQPVRPEAGLRERLMARVAAQADTTAPSLTFLRSFEGAWLEVGPGITMKTLFADPQSARTTALVRMAAGSRYDSHRHAEAEEVYVLEGTCLCGGKLLQVGDYHRAEAGTVHADTSTTDGCLMLTIASPHNQMVG